MSTNTNQFLVSVADVVLRDTVVDQVVLKGKALINSAFKQTLNNQEIRGGQGDKLLYVFSNQKKLDVSIESATFDEAYIALNNGVNIVNQAKDFYTIDEVVTLSNNSGTLANTPAGNIYVQKADNAIATITPSGKDFTVAGGGNTTVKVTYRSSTTVDTITIDAGSTPNAYELTMSAKIFQGSGQTAELQIVIPQFKVSGSFDLSFTASGASTNKLDGMALANQADNSYATVMIKPVGSGTISYAVIAATPSSVSLSATATTQQLTVYGIRGGMASNMVVTSGCTFASSATGIATVNSSGLITRVAAGTTYITVTHTASGLTDTVAVTSA